MLCLFALDLLVLDSKAVRPTDQPVDGSDAPEAHWGLIEIRLLGPHWRRSGPHVATFFQQCECTCEPGYMQEMEICTHSCTRICISGAGRTSWAIRKKDRTLIVLIFFRHFIPAGWDWGKQRPKQQCVCLRKQETHSKARCELNKLSAWDRITQDAH